METGENFISDRSIIFMVKMFLVMEFGEAFSYKYLISPMQEFDSEDVCFFYRVGDVQKSVEMELIEKGPKYDAIVTTSHPRNLELYPIIDRIFQGHVFVLDPSNDRESYE